MCVCIKNNRKDSGKMLELAKKYSQMEKKDVQFYFVEIAGEKLYDFAVATGRLHPNLIELIQYET